MALTEQPAAEHEALRTGAGLIDRSERGKLALTGAEAKAFLDAQVTNDVIGLSPGEGRYAAFLTPKGKMLGDLRILDLGDELFLDTERVSLQGLFNLIRRASIGWDAELHKRTVQRGLLSLLGPQARAVARAEDLPATEHSNAAAQLGGIAVHLVVTDAGVDVLCDAADTVAVGTELRARGAVPVGEVAAETLRVERGRPRYGLDLDDTTIPQEAGLNERAVSFTKGCYPGQETVARLHYRGKPNRHLRGLRLSAPATPGDELRLGPKVVGRVGSVAVSPDLGPLALALVRREAEPGSTVAVGDDQGTAEVVDLPFHAG